MKAITAQTLESIAKQSGLNLLSWVGVAPMAEAGKALRAWQDAGFGGEMSYMQRPAEQMCDPRTAFEKARSVVVVAARYESRSIGVQPLGTGRIARYAWGRDYHKVLPKRLKQFVQALESHLGRKIAVRTASDAVPVMERPIAEQSGLGFVGKNTMIIRPGIGSYFFLAEIFCDLELELELAAPVKLTGGCSTCSRCISACPTGAIVAPFKLDARRCISYLTIEKRGMLTVEERRMLGAWAFGCDICQEVCPFNHAAQLRQEQPEISEFSGDNFPGPFLDLAQVLALRHDEDFRKRFAGTALLRPKRAGLLRNAAIVAANTRAEQLAPVLELAAGEDPEPSVRAHALWALFELAETCQSSSRNRIDLIRRRALNDISPLVQYEAQHLEVS